MKKTILFITLLLIINNAIFAQQQKNYPDSIIKELLNNKPEELPAGDALELIKNGGERKYSEEDIFLKSEDYLRTPFVNTKKHVVHYTSVIDGEWQFREEITGGYPTADWIAILQMITVIIIIFIVFNLLKRKTT